MKQFHFIGRAFRPLLVTAAGIVALWVLSVQADQAEYLYDDLGRLSQVVDEQGNVATYTYDAVGNLLSITRSTGGVGAPTLASITPTSTPAGSTVTVTLAGENLRSAALSTDNPGIGITNVTTTATTITATFSISFLKAGPTLVTATTGAGSASIAFTVSATAPTLSSLTPTSGPPTRLVAIAGTGFSAVPAENLVRFNGVPAPTLNATPTSLLASVPVGASPGPVTVTRSGLTSNGVAFTVTAPAGPAPTISAVTPNAGPANGGTTITITGGGFAPDTQVFIGGTRALPAALLHAGAIQVTTPLGLVGPAEVRVTNANGDALLPGGFTYGGPAVTTISPAPNATGVPLNAPVQIGFSAPVLTSSVTAQSVALLLGGAPVAAGISFLQSNTVVQLAPTSPLQANTVYQVRVATTIVDTNGHVLATPFSSTFTTGSGSDTAGPTVVSRSPEVFDALTEPVALNARVMVRFSEAINANTLNNPGVFIGSGTFSIRSPFGAVPATIVVSPDQSVATLIPAQALLPNTGYTLYYYGVFNPTIGIRDVAGNLLQNPLPGTAGFSTGTVTSDTTAPQVVTVSPGDQTTGVPLNAPILIQFSEPIAAPTVSAQTLTVSYGPNPIAGTTTFERSSRVVRWKPTGGTLPSNATLTVNVTTGVLDAAGNRLLAPFTSSFTTGSASDVVSPTVTAISPALGAVDVPRTASIVVTLSEPIDPVTVVPTTKNAGSITLDGGGQFRIPGSVSFSNDRRTVTFTPDFPLFSNQSYFITVASIEDVAGRPVVTTTSSFSTAIAPGTDPNALPAAATVTVNPPTIFADGVQTSTVTIGNIHRDGIGVPDGTLIAVSAEPVFNNLFGNSSNTSVGGAILGGAPSADPRFKLFPTVGASVTVTYQSPKVVIPSSQPAAIQVVSVDAAGAPVGLIGAATITLINNRTATVKANPTTVLANGTSLADITVTVLGSSATPEPPGYQIAVTAAPVFSLTSAGGAISGGVEAPDPRFTLFTTGLGGQVAFTYTPPSFIAGQTGTAVIQVAEVDDTGTFQRQIGSLNVALNTTTGFTSPQPEVLSVSPATGQAGVGTNAAVTVQFSQPLDPATVTAATFSVGGLAGTRTLSASDRGPNTIVTFRPSAPFAANTVFSISISTGIKSATGNPLLASSFTTFMTGAGADATAPAVTRVSPPDGTTGVPTNSLVSVELSEPLNAATVTGTAVSLSAGGTAVAARLTLGSSPLGPNTVITVTMEQPLAAGTLYTLTLVGSLTDVAGNSLPAFSASFTTAAGIDAVQPTLVGISPFPNQADVPLNARVSVRFSERINPVTVNANTFKVFLSETNPVPGSISVSADLLTATFTPSQPLLPNTVHHVNLTMGIQDLAGNPLLIVQGNTTVLLTSWSFTTGTQLTDATGPTVLAISPVSGTTSVALNAPVLIRFSKPLAADSVTAQSVTLASGGSPVPTLLTLEQNNTVVRLKPANLVPLQANTLYEVSVTGVTDVAGNPVAAFTSTFTTGNSLDQTVPTIVSVSPADGATNVPRSSAIMLTFSEPINPLAVTVRTAANPSGSVSLTGADGDAPFPGTLSFSADQTTMTFTPDAPLFAGQTYFFTLEYASCCIGPSQIEDLAGNKAPITTFSFTTAVAPGTDVAALPTAATVTANPTRLFADGQGVAVVTISNISRDGTIVPDGTLIAVTGEPAYRFLVFGSLQTPGGTILDGTASSADPRFKLFPTMDGQVTLSYQTPSLSLPPGNSTSGLIQVASVDAEGAPSKLIGLGGVELVSSSTAALTANPVNLLANGTSFSAISIVVKTAGNASVPPGTRIGVTAAPVYDLTSAGGVINGGDPAPDSRFRLFSTFGAGNVDLTYTPPVLPAGQTAQAVIQAVQVDGAGNVTGFLGSTTINLSGSSGFTAPQPTVLVVSPPNGFSGAPTNTKVQAQFSQALDPATVNSSNFSVTIVATPVAGSFTLGASDRGPNTLVTFTPADPLPPNTSLSLAITTGIKSQTGNPLVASSFTTFATGVANDTTAPTVLTVNPSDALTGVPTTTAITVEFSEPVSPATVNGASLTVTTGGAVVPGRWSLSSGSHGPSSFATFTPDQFLAPNAQYTLSVASGVLDLAGNALASGATATFTTGTGADSQQPSVVSVSPPSGATGVPTTTTITITFSEPMNPSSFTSSNLRMSGAFPIGTVPFGLNFSNNNTVVTATPLSPLLAGNFYTFTVGTSSSTDTGPTDIAGNRLLSTFSTNFTTALAPGTGSLPDSAGASTSPTSFVANGLTSATITISNVRRSGVLVPDGTPIAVTADPISSFPSVGGTITGAGSTPAPDPRFRLFTTVGGTATATYTPTDLAGVQPFTFNTGFVQVFSVDAANQPVAFIGSVSTSLLGVSSATLTASPTTLPANGTSTATITVTVRDRNGTLVPDGTRVGLTAAPIFQTSAGGAIVNGTTSPTDPRVQIFTTTSGQFTATYRTPTSKGSGSAAVQAVTVDPQGDPTYFLNAVTITLQ